MFLSMDFGTCPNIMGLSDCFDKTGSERAAKYTYPGLTTTVWIENIEHIDNIDDTVSSNVLTIPKLIDYKFIYF